jgi:hypothetical protein
MSRNAKPQKLNESAPARPQPHQLWRTLPAEAFDAVRRCEVMSRVGSCVSNNQEWRGAAAGDAAGAVRIVLRMKVPEEITYPVDAMMTVLLHCALNGSAAAALVLSHVLRKMPLDANTRSRLATSWLVHNFRLAASIYAESNGDSLSIRPSVASQDFEKPERKL